VTGGTSFLAALPDDVRSDAEASLRRSSYHAGAVVLNEGDLSTDFFVILSGMVEVVRGGEVVNRLGAGEVFGEAGALDAGPGYAMARNATIRAEGDLELGVLSEADFTRLFAGSEAFRTAVVELLTARS
jgi:CRP/FNR family cyclic AMP-dependent transcriptional regulator